MKSRFLWLKISVLGFVLVLTACGGPNVPEPPPPPTNLAVYPNASTCDGVSVGQTCDITVSLVNNTLSYLGFQFDMAFDNKNFSIVEEVSKGSLLGDGCFISAGPSKVIAACEALSISGTGELAKLTVKREGTGEASFIISNVQLIQQGSDLIKTPVTGGNLDIGGAN